MLLSAHVLHANQGMVCWNLIQRVGAERSPLLFYFAEVAHDLLLLCNACINCGRDGTLARKLISTQVRAAELSRMFSKPENAAKAQRDVIYNKAKVTSNEVTGLVGDAYWQETQYRFQLYEKGRWGRTSMLTVPTTFGSNQGYAMRDQLEISLVGEDAIKDSYRAAGPAHKMLGWLWEQTGAEFTPGQTYHFKVQALPRGLPFYESGCKNGQVTCEGQEGNESAYSEPVTIQWLAPKDIDNRSLFKKFKDFQKYFQIL